MLSTNINSVKNYCSGSTFTYFLNKSWLLGLFLGLFLVLASGVLPGCSDKTTGVSEGTIDNPNIFTYAPNLRLTGTVGDVSSYYKVKGLSGGTIYDISISGFDENLDLFVYENGFQETSFCEVTGNDRVKICQVTLAASSELVYLEIRPTAYQDGTRFSLFVVERP